MVLTQSDWCLHKKRKSGHTERHQRGMHIEKRLRKGIARRRISASQGEKPTMLTVCLPNCEKVNYCCLSHPVHFYSSLSQLIQIPHSIMQHKYQVIEIKLCMWVLWRRQWHPTPVRLPGKSHGWRSLVGCSLWGR